MINNSEIRILKSELVICPLGRSALEQHLFQGAIPFFFAYRLADPVVVLVAFRERHVVRNEFHNPRFGDSVVQELAELEVLLARLVGMVQNNQGGGLTDNQGRFQKICGILDGIATVHRGIFCQVSVLQQPTESPLAQPVQTAGRRRGYKEDVSHGLKDR